MSTMSMDSAQQFIGSKISLISKADIRYEGTFYSLDLRDATISLAKVRSFGTEDRPTDRPIPMKDEIYEFIVFRGADIKSIDVVAPPQRNSTMPCGLPQDPAIVEVSHFTRGANHGGHGHQCHEQNCREHHSVRYATQSQRDGLFDSLLRGSGRPQRGNQRRSSNDNNGSQPDRRGNNGGRQSNRGERNNPEGRSRQEYRGGSSAGNNGNNQNQDNRRGRGNSPNRNNQGNNSNNNGSNRNNRDNREGSRNRNQQNRQRGIIEPQLPPKVTFEDPFDFEKSNEELKTAMEKLKIGGDEEKKDADANGPNAADKKDEPLIYYDKDKFFDNISCEALERKQGKTGRVDWRAERKLNAETFGLSWNPNQSRNQRNGNFGRPRNFRGYRGGMRYNYNRYNRNSSFGNGFNNGGGSGNRGQP